MHEPHLDALNTEGAALLAAGQSATFLEKWRAAGRPLVGPEGVSWLMAACTALCPSVVRALLAAGAPATASPGLHASWRVSVPLLAVLAPSSHRARRLTPARRAALQFAIVDQLVKAGADPDQSGVILGGQGFRSQWLTDHSLPLLKTWVAHHGRDWVRHRVGPKKAWHGLEPLNAHCHYEDAVVQSVSTDQPQTLALILDWAQEEGAEIGQRRSFQAMTLALHGTAPGCLELLIKREVPLHPNALGTLMSHARGRWHNEAESQRGDASDNALTRPLLREFARTLVKSCRLVFDQGEGRGLSKNEQGYWVSTVVSWRHLGEGDPGVALLEMARDAGWRGTGTRVRWWIQSMAKAGRPDLLPLLADMLPTYTITPGEGRGATVFSAVLSGIGQSSKNTPERVAQQEVWGAALEKIGVRLNHAPATLLHHLWHSFPEWIGWALQHGAPAHAQNKGSQTALMQAILAESYQGSLSAESEAGLRALASAPGSWADWVENTPLNHWAMGGCRIPLPLDCVPPDLLSQPDRRGHTPLDVGLEVVLGDAGVGAYDRRPLDGFGVSALIKRLTGLVEAGGRPSPGSYVELRPRLVERFRWAAQQMGMTEAHVPNWLQPFDAAALDVHGVSLSIQAPTPRRPRL